MNYKTYAEAKIANPDSDIVTTGNNWSGGKDLLGTFEAVITGSIGRHIIDDKSWVICNPADYCSSIKEFLDAGFKLTKGDFLINRFGNVGIADDNLPDKWDHKRYILSAASLNGGCKIPTKPEQWTVYNNTLQLCELTDEQAAMLFNAWRNGDNIQYRTMNVTVWIDKPEYDAVIKKGGVYRVKSKSERELFIEHTTKVMRDAGTKCQDNHEYFGIMFDAGARYKDLTQHFGENI